VSQNTIHGLSFLGLNGARGRECTANSSSKISLQKSHKNRISGSGVLEISISSVQEDIMEERKTYEEAESIVKDLH
jgi:hypothetical protein